MRRLVDLDHRPARLVDRSTASRRSRATHAGPRRRPSGARRSAPGSRAPPSRPDQCGIAAGLRHPFQADVALLAQPVERLRSRARSILGRRLAKADCTPPGATATILFAADPGLVHDRLRHRGAGPRPPLAVEHDVDALVVEGDEAGHRRGVLQRILVAPGQVRVHAPDQLDRPVRRLSLVRAVGLPGARGAGRARSSRGR